MPAAVTAKNDSTAPLDGVRYLRIQRVSPGPALDNFVHVSEIRATRNGSDIKIVGGEVHVPFSPETGFEKLFDNRRDTYACTKNEPGAYILVELQAPTDGRRPRAAGRRPGPGGRDPHHEPQRLLSRSPSGVRTAGPGPRSTHHSTVAAERARQRQKLRPLVLAHAGLRHGGDGGPGGAVAPDFFLQHRCPGRAVVLLVKTAGNQK